MHLDIKHTAIHCCFILLMGAGISLIHNTVTYFLNKVFQSPTILKKISYIFSDCLLIVYITLSFILIIYYVNRGIFRSIYLLSLLAGFIIFKLIFSRILDKILEFVCELLLFIISPVYKITIFLFKTAKKALRFFFTPIAKIGSSLYNKIKDKFIRRKGNEQKSNKRKKENAAS